MEESQIIAQLKAGSEKAFDQAYKKYARELLAYSLSYTKSKEDSEEIVQDTFIKLWNHRAEIKNEQSLKPFLFTIAHRRIIDLLRQRVNSCVFEDYVKYSNEMSDTNAPLDYDNYISVLKRSIESLPQKQATILRLSKFEGKSIEQIAQMLSISEKTVKNQLSFGNKILLSLIQKIFFVLFLCKNIGTFIFE